MASDQFKNGRIHSCYENQCEVVDHSDGGEEEDHPDHVFELSWKSPLLDYNRITAKISPFLYPGSVGLYSAVISSNKRVNSASSDTCMAARSKA